MSEVHPYAFVLGEAVADWLLDGRIFGKKWFEWEFSMDEMTIESWELCQHVLAALQTQLSISDCSEMGADDMGNRWTLTLLFLPKETNPDTVYRLAEEAIRDFHKEAV